MRIALVIERMDPLRGGRETYTARLAEALGRRGHEVTVLCHSGSWACNGVEVRRLGRRGVRRTRRMPAFIQDAADAAAESDYDVVHAMLTMPGADIYHPHGGTVPGSLAANRRRRSSAGRLLHRFLSPLNASRRLRAKLERRIMADPNVICLAVSEMIAGHFREYYGRERGVRVAFNGVDVPDWTDERRADQRQQLRARLEVGPDDPVFLTVATNFPLKGVAETIAALAKWYDARGGDVNPRLVVVGRQRVEGYQRLASRLGIAGLVVFEPPTKEIFRWYAAADVLVLLTWYDPCSLTVLEAARWGIPSLTTAFNGAREALGEAGIVVASPRDTRGIVSALDELADPARRGRRAEACGPLGEYLGMDRHVDELLEVYEEVRRHK